MCSRGAQILFTPRATTVDGEKVIMARGACDMKGGLIAAWAAVNSCVQVVSPQEEICSLLPVIGEEDGGLGTYSLITEGLPQFYSLTEHQVAGAIIPEPTSLAAISANGGALTFRLLVHGAAIHASRRTEGVSAIEKFYPIYQALEILEARRNVDVRFTNAAMASRLSYFNWNGAQWRLASTVPDLLVAEGRFGVALGEDIESARSIFEECIRDASAKDLWLAENPVKIEWWGGQFTSGQTEPRSETDQKSPEGTLTGCWRAT